MAPSFRGATVPTSLTASAVLAPSEPEAAASHGAVYVDHLLVVDFTAGGTAKLYQTEGWAEPESRLTWAVGPGSGLRLPAPWGDRPHVLELDVNPCRYPPHVTGQMLTVHVNGRCFGTHVLTGRAVLRCTLPPEIWRDRDAIEVKFAHPNYFVPRLLGPTLDDRPLAISFYAVRLYSEHVPGATVSLPLLPIPMAAPLVVAEQAPPGPPPTAGPQAGAASWGFGIERPGSVLAVEGWAPPEAEGQRTRGPFARLEVPPLPGPGAYLLRVDCAADIAREVAVSLAGRVLAHLPVGPRASFGVPLPIEESPWPGPLDIGLHVREGEHTGWVCLHEIATEPLPPVLAGWAGLRVDRVARPARTPRGADRFCAVPEAQLQAAIQADLAIPAASLLPVLVNLGETAAATARVPGMPPIIVQLGAASRSVAEMLPVLQAVNRDGPATLLYVVAGAPPERSGAVEALGPGLMRGQVGGFAQGGAGVTISTADWLRLAANAVWLRADGGKPAQPPAAAPMVDAPHPTPAPPPVIAPPAPAPPAPSQPAPTPAPARDTGPPPLATMLRGFESLGDSSEFGTVQRKAGVEVLGLLRFADITLQGIIDGLADDFAALADPAAISIAVDAAACPDYVLSVDRYGLRWPTGISPDEADTATVLQRQSMKLGYLRRKFLESLRAGGRIYVLRRDEALAETDVAPVAEALARHGRNTLLYVVPGATPDEAGDVTAVAPGLLRGHLEQLAPRENPAAADIAGWLRLITNAWWQQDR